MKLESVYKKEISFVDNKIIREKTALNNFFKKDVDIVGLTM